MKYLHKTFNGDSFKRITRKKAIELLKNNKKITLYTLPINYNPNSKWINGFFEIEQEAPFTDYIDSINTINEIIYYNCNREAGLYLKFYIKEEDVK